MECPKGTVMSEDGRICKPYINLPNFDLSTIERSQNDKSLQSNKDTLLQSNSNLILTEKLCAIQYDSGTKETKCVCEIGYESNFDGRTCKGFFFYLN